MDKRKPEWWAGMGVGPLLHTWQAGPGSYGSSGRVAAMPLLKYKPATKMRASKTVGFGFDGGWRQ